MKRRRRQLSGTVVAALAGALASVPAGAIDASERDPQVRVATTGNRSERVKTLRITHRPGTERRVVMSLGPRRLPDLMRGDRVGITAELGVST